MTPEFRGGLRRGGRDLREAERSGRALRLRIAEADLPDAAVPLQRLVQPEQSGLQRRHARWTARCWSGIVSRCLPSPKDCRAGSPGFSTWDPFPLLCPGSTCSMLKDGKPLFFDADHVSGFANRLLLADFVRKMDELGAPRALAARLPRNFIW